jgi:hypothetical protein
MRNRFGAVIGAVGFAFLFLSAAVFGSVPGFKGNVIHDDRKSAADTELSVSRRRPSDVLVYFLAGKRYISPTLEIPITVAASDSDGTVVRVEFYKNGTDLIGVDTDGADGWSYNWTGMSAGSYALTAVAYDNEYPQIYRLPER